MRNHLCRVAVSLVLSIMAAGCASGGKEVTDKTPLQDLDAPEWVMKGSGASGGKHSPAFYGVASAYGMRNFSLLRSTADNRARDELAKVFQSYTASLMRDYMASTSPEDSNAIQERHPEEQVIETVTPLALSGVEIVDHWQHPKTGEFFSLARLSLDAFKGSLDQATDLDAGVRDYFRQNAERLHAQLEDTGTKLQGEP